MTAKQIIAIAVTAAVVCLMLLCRPYSDSSDINTDLSVEAMYHYYKSPLPDGNPDSLSLDGKLLRLQYFFMAVTLLTALISFRPKATRRERSVLLVSLLIEISLFASNRIQPGTIQPSLGWTLSNCWCCMILLACSVFAWSAFNIGHSFRQKKTHKSDSQHPV